MHKVFVDPRAKEQLFDIKCADKDRIEKKIDSLARTPRPPDCKKLQGTDGLYRVRSGNYRIIYQVRDRELVVLIIRIGHRRDVYR